MTTVVAVDGVGGCGKSTVLSRLEERLKLTGNTVGVYKFGGLGNSPLEMRLKERLSHREGLISSGDATPRQLEDKARDLIFRIATRYQARKILELTHGGKRDFALLDRTPFMGWVYSKARDPSNQYLDEILEEACYISTQVGLQHVFLLDVSPITAFARLVARVSADTGTEPHEICRRIDLRGANETVASEIVRIATRLLFEVGTTARQNNVWDYVPWSVKAEECRLFREIFLSETVSFKATIVNAEVEVDQIVDQIAQRLIE